MSENDEVIALLREIRDLQKANLERAQELTTATLKRKEDLAEMQKKRQEDFAETQKRAASMNAQARQAEHKYWRQSRFLMVLNAVVQVSFLLALGYIYFKYLQR